MRYEFCPLSKNFSVKKYGFENSLIDEWTDGINIPKCHQR